MVKKNNPQKNKMQTVIEYQFQKYLPTNGNEGHLDKKVFHTIFDINGERFDVERIILKSFFVGENGKEKIRVLMDLDNLEKTTITQELSKLDYFYIIDTNYEEIRGRKLSVACAIKWKVTKFGDKFSAHTLDEHIHIMQFLDIDENDNPEMLAVLMMANHVRATENIGSESRIGIINDSNRAEQHLISSRKLPIYKEYFLPEGFKLFYAGDDGNGLLNQLIRFCDKQAKKYLISAKLGLSPKFEFEPCCFNRNVSFGSFNLKLTPYTTKLF